MKSFIETYGFLIVLFPLLGAAMNGFLGGRVPARLRERFVGIVGSGSVLLSFLLSLIAFREAALADGAPIINHVYTWIDVGALRTDVAFLFDPLSALMLLIVTGIGFLIHVYSTAYMKGDPGFHRYFAYLNLFVFAMLLLVLAENALLMFIGWEGVGLCSYLLIGFWFHDNANAAAANKAFIVNRIGDFGFIIGLLLLFWFLGPGEQGASVLSFPYLQEHAHLLQGRTILGIGLATVICLALFLGATGKSAQIPLYVWLPDAMAGPTPVSALIHAATMVTAGVYMIARLNFLFSLSEAAMAVVAITGAATALFAATMGCVQNDIKKVLAYSTVSQLGYMMLGMGVGAFSAGMFHVVTHAFFKACLFLGAGSVILGTHHEQDIRNMGGLRGPMPVTFATFAVAAAAIAGVPPLSGFFSKDEILWQAFSSPQGHPLLWLAGLATAGITAFYMARLLLLVFFGENRQSHGGGHGAPEGHDHPVQESPAAITIPLVILAACSAVAGSAGVPEALGGTNGIARFLAPLVGHHAPSDQHAVEYVMMAASVLVAACGIGIAYVFYVKRPELPDLLATRFSRLHQLVFRKYFVDEAYAVLFVSGTKMLSKAAALFDTYVVDLLVNLSGLLLRTQARVAGWFDAKYVDGAVNLTADSAFAFGGALRKMQTGRVQVYMLILLLSVAAGVVVRMIL